MKVEDMKSSPFKFPTAAEIALQNVRTCKKELEEAFNNNMTMTFDSRIGNIVTANANLTIALAELALLTFPEPSIF